MGLKENLMNISSNSYNVKKEENRNQPKFDREKIMKAVTMIIEAIGDDPSREGLIGTPDSTNFSI